LKKRNRKSRNNRIRKIKNNLKRKNRIKINLKISPNLHKASLPSNRWNNISNPWNKEKKTSRIK